MGITLILTLLNPIYHSEIIRKSEKVNARIRRSREVQGTLKKLNPKQKKCNVPPVSCNIIMVLLQ